MQCCWLHLLPGYTLPQAWFAVYEASKPSPKNWSQHVHHQTVLLPRLLCPKARSCFSHLNFLVSYNPFLQFLGPSGCCRHPWMWYPIANLVSSLAMSWRRFQSVCSSGLRALNSSCPLTDLLSTSFVTKSSGRTWPINHELWVQLPSQFIISMVIYYLDCTFEKQSWKSC